MAMMAGPKNLDWASMLNHCISELSMTLIHLFNKKVNPDTVTTKPKALPLVRCLPPSLMYFMFTIFTKTLSPHHLNASSSTDILAYSISLGWILYLM